MTEHLFGLPIAGQTDHFLVTFGDESDQVATVCASGVLESCEADLEILEGWFGVSFGENNVWIHLKSPLDPGGGATNWGYDGAHASRMLLEGTFFPDKPDVATGVLRRESAKMLVVAELAEILMDFAGGSWGRRDSNGEGLSLLAASVLRPIGFYPTKYGPQVNTWLTSADRQTQDWVSRTELTDLNPVSRGCALLFLNYLVHQRGFTVQQIIAAGSQWGDNTARAFGHPVSLAEIYHRLTGEPAAKAFAEFTSVLDRHLPPTPASSLGTDNPFPLRDRDARSVFFGWSSTKVAGGGRDPIPKSVNLVPGPLCASRDFDYYDEGVVSEVTISAVAIGFALPVWDWTVGGVKLSISGSLAVLPVPMIVSDSTPAPNESPVNVTLPVRYLISRRGLSGERSTLVLRNLAFPGNGVLKIEVAVREKLITNDSPVSRADTVDLLTRTYDLTRSGFGTAVRRCNPEEMSVLDSMAHRLYILTHPTGPRPPESTDLRTYATAATEYLRAMDVLTGGVRGLETTIAAAAAVATRDDAVTARIGDRPEIVLQLDDAADDESEGADSSSFRP